jgi:Asp-tRNA(Asn)/Glu-tRNA(Gln) amidotransferase A subunit family amidase
MLIRTSRLAVTAEALREGALPVGAHVIDVCERIEAVDARVRAFLPETGRRERLLREAAALERRYAKAKTRPLLYGCVLGVKDVFNVDGFETRAGSALPPELFAGPEAPVVARLRKAGALVAGKTESAEFAMFAPAPTRNPRAPGHTPGGSSSGSAAAVAAGMVALALGTQTGGSTIRPAAYCGVVGLKPSYGRVPIDGVVPCSPSLDTVGLFTQDVSGMALAASVVLDGWRTRSVKRPPVVGVPDGPYLEHARPGARREFERQLARLAEAGFEVRRLRALEHIERLDRQHTWLMLGQGALQHRAWFAEYRAMYRPQTAALIGRGRRVTKAQLARARAGQSDLRERLHAIMDAAGIDLWASPAATGPAPRGLSSTGDPALNKIWTYAGMPAITLPAGRSRGVLPLGLQLCARFGDDERLLAWAEAIESVLQVTEQDDAAMEAGYVANLRLPVLSSCG